MSIILDPNKQLINIESYFIEKTRTHGNSVFHFIKSKDELEYWQNRGYVFEKDAPKDEEGKITTDQIIKTIQTSWKPMSWRDQNTVFSKSIRQVHKPNGSYSAEIDTIAFRDWKLKTCLKKWDVKAPDGSVLEVSEGLIDNLDPTVAQELLSAFEKVTEPSEEDLKN